MRFLQNMRKLHRPAFVAIAALAALVAAPPATAQDIQQVDPDTAIDGDMMPPPAPATQAQAPASTSPAVAQPHGSGSVDNWNNSDTAPTAPTWSEPGDVSHAATQASEYPQSAVAHDTTYKEDDLIGAAEGVFGQGAESAARLIQQLLRDQGEPNAYIVGREASGAFIVGTRYGSGTLFHKVEGKRPVYWTGPTIGFDAGANAGNTFVLVYNLFDSEELYERFPAGEGQAYAIGGMTASYLRKGDKVLIPIRVGAGLRLGVNAGYMKFSKKQRWLPF